MVDNDDAFSVLGRGFEGCGSAGFGLLDLGVGLRLGSFGQALAFWV